MNDVAYSYSITSLLDHDGKEVQVKIAQTIKDNKN